MAKDAKLLTSTVQSILDEVSKTCLQQPSEHWGEPSSSDRIQKKSHYLSMTSVGNLWKAIASRVRSSEPLDDG